MSSRWYNVALALFWCTTMGWLIVSKVLPPLLVGDPPSYRTIVERRSTDEELLPVGWTMRLNGKPLGWATNQARVQYDGATALVSRVHFDRLPLTELAPGAIGALLQRWGGLSDSAAENLGLETFSTLDIDPLGQPISFRSTTSFGRPGEKLSADNPNHFDNVVSIVGTVEAGQLKLTVKTGEVSYKTTTAMPAGSLLADALAPQTELPNLRIGQKWTMPTFSPFRPPGQPLEMLHAEVVRTGLIFWGGTSRKVLVVEYRGDSGSELGPSRARGYTFVTPEGMVVKQEIAVLDSKLSFVRMSAEEVAQLVPPKPGHSVGSNPPPGSNPPSGSKTVGGGNAPGAMRGQR